MPNTIMKLMTNGYEDEDLILEDELNFQEFTTKSEKEFREIPLDKIKKREINDYSITDIETLAKSIIDNGLQQHIIVRTDGDEYVLIAGERRVSAYYWIINKYKAEGRNYDKYLTIPAEVYTSISKKQEEEIYRTTNDTQRNSSLFEKIYRFNPCEKFFFKAKGLDGFDKSNDVDVAKVVDYFRLKEKDKKYQFNKTAEELATQVAELGKRMEENVPFVSYHQNLIGDVISVRWDSSQVMNEYIRMKLIEMNSDINVSTAVIRRYTNWIVRTYKPIIREFIFCQNPPINTKDLGDIYLKSEEEQILIYQALKEGTYKVKPKLEQEEAPKEISYEDKFNSFLKEVEGLTTKFEDLDFIAHKKELTGNQKELLKEVQKVIKSITKLSEKPH